MVHSPIPGWYTQAFKIAFSVLPLVRRATQCINTRCETFTQIISMLIVRYQYNVVTRYVNPQRLQS
jgi:hypothetical protein